MTEDKACNIIASRIRGCYGSVDLHFAHHTSDEDVARYLRDVAKQAGLSRFDVEDAITPVITRWLENDYVDFSGNVRPLSPDMGYINYKVSKMVDEAASFISP